MRQQLIWAIRRSFLEYLEAQPDTTIEVTGGAQRLSTGEFGFPVTRREPGLARARGTLRIRAHSGALDFELSDPLIRLDAELGWVLEWSAAGRSATRARLLDAVANEGPVTGRWRSADVALTMDGAELFGGAYGPWTRMDPVELR